jgi:hypothetical protein
MICCLTHDVCTARTCVMDAREVGHMPGHAGPGPCSRRAALALRATYRSKSANAMPESSGGSDRLEKRGLAGVILRGRVGGATPATLYWHMPWQQSGSLQWPPPPPVTVRLHHSVTGANSEYDVHSEVPCAQATRKAS